MPIKSNNVEQYIFPGIIPDSLYTRDNIIMHSIDLVKSVYDEFVHVFLEFHVLFEH